MTERENFLERWSRKKTEARRETQEVEKPDAPEALLQTDERSDGEPVAMPAGRPAAPPAATPPIAEFDLASLPSLDSITSATDIRPFLTAGVPQELSRAALRRAWAVDPAIRDFVGLAENQWDFTDPAAVPGFGEMLPGTDVKKMISEIFGEMDRMSERAQRLETTQSQVASKVASKENRASEPGYDTLAPDADAGLRSDRQADGAGVSATSERASILHCDLDGAAQQENPEPPSEGQAPRRQHGGALPRS